MPQARSGFGRKKELEDTAGGKRLIELAGTSVKHNDVLPVQLREHVRGHTGCWHKNVKR